MTKRDDKGRLRLKSERLRQLTGLSGGDMGLVAGGTRVGQTMMGGGVMLTTSEQDSAGRAYSRTCIDS